MKRRLKIPVIFAFIVIAILSSVSICYAQGQKSGDKSSTQSADQLLPSDIQTREDFLPEESNTRLGAGYYFNLFISLLIIAGMIVGIGYLFRYLFARMPSFAGKEDFKVLNSIRMSPQATLYAVRFADEIYLLAATAQKVTVVSRIDDPDKVKDIADSMSDIAGMTNPHAFPTLLSKKFEKEMAPDANLDKEKLKKDQNRFGETLKRLESYERLGDEEEKRK